MIYNYNKLTPFKKYIIQNFPYIDGDFDALTNYELFAKVVDYLNQVIESNNNQDDQIEALTNAYNDLHDYVQDYFDNLDVQEEINNKLDEMTSTGQLQELVNSIFVTLENQISSIASGSPAGVYATLSDLQTADPDHTRIYVVTATGKWYYWNGSQWAEGGTYQSTELIIDNTLTKSQTPADSLTVGNAFKSISDIKNNYNLFNYMTITEKSSYNADGSSIMTDNNFILTDYIEVEPETRYISTASGTSAWGRRLTYNNRVTYFDASKTKISFTNIGNYSLPNTTILTPANCKYIRVSFSVSGGTKADALSQQVMVIKTTDTTSTVDERIPFILYGLEGKITKNNLSNELKNDSINIETIVSDMTDNESYYNLFNIDECTLNSVDTSSDIPVYYNTNRHCSNLIEIKDNKKYIVTIKGTNTWGRAVASAYFVFFFDANMNFISKVDTVAISIPNTLITPPANAKYMRLSVNASSQADLIEREIMVLETTTETCATDERVPYKAYQNKQYKISENNLSTSLKNAIFSGLTNTYRYLTLTFNGTSQNAMILLGSNDLRTFDLLAEKGVYTASLSNSVRDPAVIKIKDYYYITYTTIGFSTGNAIGFCRTKNFVDYEELSPLTVKDSTDESKVFYQVWAPAWFRDTDGKLYIITSTKESENDYFYATINEYDAENHELKSGIVTNINYIDGHIIYDNSNYYMFVGGGRLFKTNTITGTWTQLNNLNYGGYEADFPIKLDNGKWRLYMQQLDASFTSHHMVYIDADTIEGQWSNPTLVQYTKEANDYGLELDSTEKGAYWHWTIYDMKELNGNNNNIVEL